MDSATYAALELLRLLRRNSISLLGCSDETIIWVERNEGLEEGRRLLRERALAKLTDDEKESLGLEKA